MAPREDVVSSAVAFLQDPSVASSSLDKRIAFLQSKNLTQEEIDISLARAGSASQSAGMAPPPPPPPGQYRSGQQPAGGYGYGYGYGGYPPGGPWLQQPSEPPRRDWRDWFIMATVTAGVGYGLFAAAQRYILPLISPPTPPQLEQDKAYIDASFAKAFTLIDQLTSDTAAFQASEASRTEKLDTTLSDIDTVVAELKAANTRREAESRITADQLAGLKELVPKTLTQWKQNGDARLDELGVELQSLKKLLENRVGGRSEPRMPTTTTSSTSSFPLMIKSNGPPSAPSASSETTMSSNLATAIPAPAPGVDISKRETSSPQGMGAGAGRSGGAARAAIPAWQMAAAGAGAGAKKKSSGNNNNDPAPSLSLNGEGGSSAEAGN